ncbi:hypothetical protein J8L97_14435 [Pseudoalteromonas sp. MMG012]|nr:hypothetical protein [Pseudoalteromonas sp. MMG012]
MNLNVINTLKKLVLMSTLTCLSACNVTHFQKNNAIALAQKGELVSARTTIKRNYSSQGKNRLLYHLELATYFQLEKKYAQSNEHLSEAKDLLDSFYTKSISEQALSQFSGPTYTTFHGQKYYRPLLHMMKAMNYNALGTLQPTRRQEMLDASLIEMRQLNVYLEGLTEETGGYHAPSSDELTNQVYAIFQPLFSPSDLLTNIEYKDDAFAHYLSGLLNEQSGELDSARLQYQRAALAYEKGFAKQYQLPNQTTEQVYKNLVRVMKQAGGYEEELSHIQSKVQPDNVYAGSQLTILQNLGVAPKRKQFNLILRADHKSKALVITPIPMGSHREQQIQMKWFQMLFADTSLFDMMQNYAMGDISDVALGLLTKRIPLGGLWDDAKKVGLIDALEYGGRISVTYLSPSETRVQGSEVWVNGKKQSELKTFYSIELLTLQNALENANTEIQLALTREVVKAITAQQLLNKTGLQENNVFSGIAKLATSAVNAVTASADTRQWQSLPAEIRVSQIPLPVGQHQVTIKTVLNSGRVIEQTDNVDVKGPMSLWQTRTFINSQKQPTSSAQSIFTLE